ncbi:MAG: glutathione S-transferase N-terminal domain-containing protein [Candidatus Gastranaerophilaceae bacterium]
MLEIFILETCPYCHKVLTFLDENNIKYKKIDIAQKQNEEALIKIGGKRQVPFLVDKKNGVEMYESDDIIEYLKTL